MHRVFVLFCFVLTIQKPKCVFKSMNLISGRKIKEMKMPATCFDMYKCQIRVASGLHGGSFELVFLKQLSRSPGSGTLTQKKASCKKLDFNEKEITCFCSGRTRFRKNLICSDTLWSTHKSRIKSVFNKSLHRYSTF